MTFFENAPQLSFCCFCATLRTGTIAIGITEVLVFLAYLRLGLRENFLQNASNWEYMFFVGRIVEVILGTALVIGVIKRSSRAILLYLFTELFFIIFNVAYLTQSFARSTTSENNTSNVFFLFVLFFSFYGWCITNSYYQELVNY